MTNQDRASAQPRIAASTPKNTYGKHKNKLLPLTGSQFLRNDATNVNSKSNGTKDTRRQVDPASSSDDSPLSDAEPIHRVEDSRSAMPPARRTQAQKSEGHLSPSELSRRNRMTVNHHEARRPVRSTKEKGEGKLKSTRTARARLPLNELVMVSGARSDDVFEQPERSEGAEAISSSVQPLLDAMLSDDSEERSAKRKAKKPLSAIRKRIRTPPSGYKSLERLRKSHYSTRITPTGSRPRQVAGDGFEKSELNTSPAYRRLGRRSLRQREPLLAGLQALSLVSGPLPDVVFTNESSPSQLKLQERDVSYRQTYETPSDDLVPAVVSLARLDHSTEKRVSFDERAERSISAQLASISAPRREPSVSCGSESGDDGDESSSDEGDLVHEDDDEAADTYLDQHELPFEEDRATMDEPDFGNKAHLLAPVQGPGRHLQNSIQPSNDDGQSTSVGKNLPPQSTRSSRKPSFRLQSSPEKRALNEVNEFIEDDFCIEDMLLGDEKEDPPPNYSSIEGLWKNAPNFTSHVNDNVRTHSRNQTRDQTASTRTSSNQPRSILKNSTPYISSDTNRSESTAANTRRNSFIDLEESGYFSAAKDQLDSIPYKQPIIRKKSSSRFFEPIQVPFSDERVPETSPRKPIHSDGSSMHLLGRTDDAIWTSNAARVPQTDLGSLTRSVSRDNGTLSQSVRRRSSLNFQSPHFTR